MTEPMTLTAEHADFLRKIMPFFQALKAHFDDRAMLSALSDGAVGLGAIADAIEAAIKARDAQAVSVPDGWALVPAMATENMRAAGGSAYEHTCEESTWDDAENIYKAMLAAVPQPPVQEKDHE